MPDLEPLCESSNPSEHVLHYHNAMIPLRIPQDIKEVMMCKMFASNLKGAALMWYYKLKPGSNYYFEDLYRKFQWQFALSIKVRKETNHMFYHSILKGVI